MNWEDSNVLSGENTWIGETEWLKQLVVHFLGDLP